MKLRIIVLFSLISVVSRAQFPGPAGTSGTSAMYKDSSVFVAWAKACIITRGYQDISNSSLGYTNVGDSSKVTGKADNDIVSLGDGGIATVTFTSPINNGPGYDFAVFENSFNDSFLELAFVEVSSDGINFFRFSATSNLPISPQYTNGSVMDATKIDNLAGKYRALYGTPFDLQEMTGIPQLDINNITHIKIIDVVGDINPPYATYDKNNNVINDPWPTPFGSGGFDLDAVGVINTAVGIKELESDINVQVYPNPAENRFVVHSSQFVENGILKVFNVIGETVLVDQLKNSIQSFDISNLEPGLYFIQLENSKGKQITRLIKN